MSKLGRKLFWRMALMICFMFIMSFLVNTYFLPKYILYQKKDNLAELATVIQSKSVEELHQTESELEQRYNATIVSSDIALNINELNDMILRKLNQDGVSLSKFWLTEESLQQLQHNMPVYKLYNQTKLDTSFLVTFLRVEDKLFLIGDSIANSEQSLRTINTFNLWIAIGTLILTLGLAWLIARQIILPLNKLAKNAENIANLDFRQTDIKTGDEIEQLAASLNQMSDNLKDAHLALKQKNVNLQRFISDISHEFKTPIALIKAYSSGIRDGLDDGTFLNVIDKKTNEMSALVDKLLHLAKLQNEPLHMGAFNFRLLLDDVLKHYLVAVDKTGKNIQVDVRRLHHPLAQGDEQKIAIVLDNFISNALKYSTLPNIQIKLANVGEELTFTIRNGILSWDEKDLAQIWEPYYVLESSRNKQLSGSGLGLSIVRTILEKHEASFGVRAANGEIEFYFSLPQR